MSRWISFCSQSLDGLRNAMPLVVALIALRAETGEIAASIPGLGACKSTYCKPRRMASGRR